MKLPNVASLALIAAIVAALEYIAAGADSIFPSIWVPVAVLLLTGIAKALQVYVEAQKAANPGARGVAPTVQQPQQSKVRRWLLD